LITGVWRDREAQLKGISSLQNHRAVSEAADPDFWALKVGEDAHIASMMTRLPTDVPRDLHMICLTPVAEVEAKNVHPRSKQAPDHVLALATGPYSRNDFGPAKCAGCLLAITGHEKNTFLSKASGCRYDRLPHGAA
jgi:hypothetical protein